MPLKVKCRTRYTSIDEESVGIKFVRPSLTQQHFREECDVNRIAARYIQTGVLPDNERPVFFGDISQVPVDLMDAYRAIELAEDNFMRLPADVRKSIDNDPARLVDWIVGNRDAAVRYGLVVPGETNVPLNDEKKEPVTPDSNGSE